MSGFSNYILHCTECGRALSHDEISYYRRWLDGKLLCFSHQPFNKKKIN